ncbi:MFS-type transporter SLC18B1-like isoform X2 [Penaeus chinensis]|nr:MFS-type transporter SLC18B1-like isoform X2 [Penaeus chinensis]XP_047493205.1 MFS-type transporter SLC18B1-like isoform X2 [Penaeus chinensis]
MTADRCKMEGRQSTGTAPTAGEQGVSPSPTSTTMPVPDETSTSTQDRGLKDAPPTPTKCQRSDSTTDIRNNNLKNQDDETDGEKVYNSTTEPIKKGNWCCNWMLRSVCKIGKRKNKGKPKEKRQKKKEEEEGGGSSYFASTYCRRQWYILLVLCLGTLTSSFAVCLFPPFFPRIAEEKGASATIYGLIIGTNCLTAFLITPVVGKNLKTIGVHFAFTAGLFCSGGCCMLTGLLEFFPGGPAFVIIAVFIRMVHATANSGILTSSFAYIAAEFPESVAKMFALTRTTMNLAQMFGPVVGGALYEVGGFKMPFLVMGSLQMAMTIFASFLLPYSSKEAEKTENETGKKKEVQIWRVFTIPGVWVSFLTFIFSTMSNGFLSVTLEPLVLRKFNLSPFYIGLLFGLKDGANSLASPIWGWACDRYQKVKLFILLASCFAFTSFFLLGPFPGVPIPGTLAIVILALSLNGCGIGGQQVAGVVDAMKEVVEGGFPDEADTHGCVAGLWSSLSGAGRFISRGGSGVLIDTIGFRKSTVIVVFLHGFIIVMTMLHLMFCGKRRISYLHHYDTESEPSESGRGVITAGANRIGTIFTTSPSEPVTTKAITIEIPGYREDFEDSLFCGSAPISTSMRYGRGRSRRCTATMESV